MAGVLRRTIANTIGLAEQLAALALADSNEAQARIDAIAAEELARTNAVTAEATTIATAVTAEETARIAADNALQTALDAEILRATTKEDFILSNVDAAAIDSISEVVTAFQNADGTLNGAITTLAGAAGANLTAEATARTTADTALQTALTAEIANRATDEAAQTTALQAYADAAAIAGGSRPWIEHIVMANNRIVLNRAPKNGLNGILNSGLVKFYNSSTNAVEEAFVTPYAPDLSGKTFTILIDVDANWSGNGETAIVQYLSTDA